MYLNLVFLFAFLFLVYPQTLDDIINPIINGQVVIHPTKDIYCRFRMYCINNFGFPDLE
jgi:hypothetical protein